MRHEELLGAGVRLYAISVDSPGRNAAMVMKLSLPFPYLSDPDRSQAIIPYEVADEKDDRLISRPALIAVTPDGREVFRFVSRDFAERMPEDEVVATARRLNLRPTTQDPPLVGDVEEGPRSLTLPALRVYMRGARFAALAMGLRHGHHAEEIKKDSKAYVSEMDRYTQALDWLVERQGSSS
ncbi:MAG: peroxiredoxin family protein [Actinobacteria bacterium]|nr:peroxiredoxin family protein [Actinomycetota bacterium]